MYTYDYGDRFGLVVLSSYLVQKGIRMLSSRLGFSLLAGKDRQHCNEVALYTPYDNNMQRYQPPHMRQRATAPPGQPQAGPSTGSDRKTHSDGTPLNNNHTSRLNRGGYIAPQPSRRDWSTPTRNSGNILSSPASDLQPIRRTPMKAIDDMEMIQSVSRSGGDGAEGDA